MGTFRLRSLSAVLIIGAVALAGVVFLLPRVNEAPDHPEPEAVVATVADPLAAEPVQIATNSRGDFRLCNQTESNVGVAIGYKRENEWTTEGWWNVPSKTCRSIIQGPLVSRYYYLYAVDYDAGGKWGGSFQMCTQARAFTIAGYQNCIARGFEQTGFYEIDTGAQQSWTVQLTEPTQQQGIGGR